MTDRYPSDRFLDAILLNDVRRAFNAEQPGQSSLPALWQAIVDNTHGNLFWIGEILLAEITKETGYRGPK